ncbi:MAG: hypothetical protein HDT20_09380, partial [Oscillibacter sp.]|nr:hypothetical protein [Oscillibacter sp.]
YQTAAKAKEIGLIDNVIEAQLGSAASREMVAEILFRAMLGEMVSYTALNGYVGTNKTLGKEKFGLESVTGVVMANEWANLNGDNVLADGKTQMKLDDGNTRTLDISSALEVVGLSCTAYMADQDKDGTLEVLTDELTANGRNNVSDNEGKAVGTGEADQYKSGIKKMASDDGITITADTEYYVDYDKRTYANSDILIRYAVEKGNTEVDEYAAEVDAGDWTGHTVESRPVTVNGETNDSWVISIRPGAVINSDDYAIMRNIFWTADRLAYITANDLALNDYVRGEVYVGTTSTVDVSDTLSWTEFVAKYFVEDKNSFWDFAVNGESVRVVDNNNDGKAEYIFDVQYTQDRVIGIRNEEPEFYSMSPDTMSGYKVVWDSDKETYTTGTVVNYRLIDNKLTVWQAPVVTDSIKTKSFQKITVTTTESGETYGQSGIWHYTRLSDRIMSMDDEVKYNMYLDQFNFIRTYELAQPTQYALLTEMYGGAVQNSNYVTSTTALAELTIGDEATKEYTVNNAATNVFLSRRGTAPDALGDAVNWTMGTGLATNRLNWLQPAIAHLLVQGDIDGYTTSTRYTVWGRSVFDADLTGGSTPVFDYGKEAGSNCTPDTFANSHSFSFTNVAAYTLKDDGTVNLNTASTYAYDRNGNPLYYVKTTRTGANVNMDKVTPVTWDTAKYGKTFEQAQADGDLARVYKTDYVQLTKENVSPNQRLFNINTGYASKYDTNSNGYVNATVNTEFYIVTPTAVKHVTGYKDLPSILGDNIRAAYAVATNTTDDSNLADYWVADVIVIETNRIEQDYDSISLFYWNPYETQGQVRYLNTLNNEWNTYGSNDYAKMQVIPGGVWGNAPLGAASYGFYELYNTNFNADDNSLTTTSINKIVRGEYNDHGIYAGALRRDAVIADTSGYVSVNIAGVKKNDPTDSTNIKNIDLDAPGNSYSAPIYHVQNNQYGQTNANAIRLVRATWTDVAEGDELIWVLDKKSNTAFVVDLAQHTGEGATPAWLIVRNADGDAISGIYWEILEEQKEDVAGYPVTVVAKDLPTSLAIAPRTIATLTAGMNGAWTFATDAGLRALYNVPGYRVANMTVTGTNAALGGVFGPSNTWALMTNSNVTVTGAASPVVITLEYEPVQWDVAMTGAATNSITGATTGYTSVTANGTDILTTPGTDKLTTGYNTTVTVEVTLDNTPAAYEKLDVTIVESTSGASVNPRENKISDTVYQYIFTMPDDDVDVTVDIVGKPANVTYKLNSLTGETLKTDTWAAITDATSDTYTVQKVNGYTATAWTAYDTTGNTPVVLDTDVNVGTDSLAVASGEWAEDITIVLTATLDEINVAFTIGAGINVEVPDGNGGWTSITTGGTYGPVTVKDTFNFKVSSSSGIPTRTVSGGGANVTYTKMEGEDVWMFTVKEAWATTPASGVTIALS